MNLRGYYNQAMPAASLMREYSLFLVLFTYLWAIVTCSRCIVFLFDTLVNWALGSHLANKDTVM